MKTKVLRSSMLAVFCFVSIIFSQTLLNIGIGPTWPKDLRETEKPTAWNGTVEIGKLFDNIVGIGVDFDFSWNVFFVDTIIIRTAPIDTITRRLDENKTFMFPISGILFFDPIPKFKVHPVIRGQIGLNMAARSIKDVDPIDPNNDIKSKKNGFYIGIIGKVGADAVFDLGEHAGIFAGFEFQWGKLRHKRRGTSSDYDYFNFNGPGIRMGLSFLF